jgi:hypothetical protein
VSGPFERTHGVATANAGGHHVVSPSDELFFRLEGHVVSGRSGTWRVEVCGVYSTDTDRWVQLNLAGPCRCGVTLRAGFRESSAIVDLLVDWLDVPFLRAGPASSARPAATVLDVHGHGV